MNNKNVYDKFNNVVTNNFTIRLLEQEDAKDLFDVYHDKDAVSLMNDDACDFGFYMDTIEQMKETVKWWIIYYEKRYFVRFSIVSKTTNKVVGTIEGFDAPECVARLDLHKDYEEVDYLCELISFIKDYFCEYFTYDLLAIKCIKKGTKRIEALKKTGFTYKGILKEKYDDYYQLIRKE